VSSRNHDRDREALRDHQDLLSRYSEVALERHKDAITGLANQMNYNRSETTDQLNRLRDEINSLQNLMAKKEIIEERTRLSVGFALVGRWTDRLEKSIEAKEPIVSIIYALTSAMYDVMIFDHADTTEQFFPAILRVLNSAYNAPLRPSRMLPNQLDQVRQPVERFINFVEQKNPKEKEEIITMVNRLFEKLAAENAE
jgi:hypothetical protein